MEPEVALGIVIRQLRTSRALSQETLALEAGLQRNYISLLERGKSAATIKTIFKLAVALDVSLVEIARRLESIVALQR